MADQDKFARTMIIRPGPALDAERPQDEGAGSPAPERDSADGPPAASAPSEPDLVGLDDDFAGQTMILRPGEALSIPTGGSEAEPDLEPDDQDFASQTMILRPGEALPTPADAAGAEPDLEPDDQDFASQTMILRPGEALPTPADAAGAEPDLEPDDQDFASQTMILRPGEALPGAAAEPETAQEDFASKTMILRPGESLPASPSIGRADAEQSVTTTDLSARAASAGRRERGVETPVAGRPGAGLILGVVAAIAAIGAAIALML